MNWRNLIVLAGLTLAMSGSAFAQSADGWRVAAYPILVWVPTTINIETNLPPIDLGDGGGGGGGGDTTRDKLIDTRFDGAYLGGVSATNGLIRLDGNVVYAAVGGDRVETPIFNVDVTLIYAYASGGIRVLKDLYATGGVRRIALKYEFSNVLGDGNRRFTRKPGVWDPVIGVGYHHVGQTFEVHGIFEGGGFGVGSDSEYFASLRGDWKPFTHFGLTAGYSFLNFTVSDDVGAKELVAEETLHGPVVGIGIYF